MIRLVSESTQQCVECGQELRALARKIYRQNEGLCPRCHLLLAEWGIEMEKVEHRDMRTKGHSQIVVPRVEFLHTDNAPKNAIPVGGI